MEKSKSYYDWELQFRKKPKKGSHLKKKEKKVNSLGISPEKFKSFLKDWKTKNLLK